jgi:putative FmdB family regulatory protein
MPTYEYRCQECGERLEIFQKFTDKALRVHPACGGPLQKIFHASGVVFKGSGYYVTDSRPNGKSTSKSEDGTSGDPAKRDTKSEKSEKSEKSKKSEESGKSEKSEKSEKVSNSATAAD